MIYKNTAGSNQIIINSNNYGKHDALQSNKLEYYSNAYKDMRKKYSEIHEEKMKLEQEIEERLNIEKKKSEILKEENKSNEEKLDKNSRDIKSLSEANKNLLVEIKSLNTLLEEINKQKEILLLENCHFRNELESS
jgi:hypothetical protein